MTRPQGTVQFDNIGRVVAVTGGCSGIGFAICEAFAQSGADVYCLDVDTQAAASLPDGVRFIRCDTSSDDDCRKAVSEIVAAAGGLDVLVNNAAIQPPESNQPIDELPLEIWNRLVAINFSGYTLMARYALSQMKQQQSGVVVNIASAQGHRTTHHVGCYGPIKAANLMQSRQWGIDYARSGVRVVSVSPGAIDTPLARAILDQQGGGPALANRHPLGRMGQPDEIAQAVLWLTSGAASFVTATDLEVDGGLGAFAAFADPYPMPE